MKAFGVSWCRGRRLIAVVGDPFGKRVLGRGSFGGRVLSRRVPGNTLTGRSAAGDPWQEVLVLEVLGRRSSARGLWQEVPGVRVFGRPVLGGSSAAVPQQGIGRLLLRFCW